MPEFHTKLDTGSEAFAQNRADMLARIEEWHGLSARAEALSEKRRSRFEERGQLTPRERVHRLLDPGMPFVELYGMANFLVEDPDPETSIPGASLICGIGFVEGVRCMIVADDSGIDAGAATRMTLDKMIGVMDLSLRMKLPFVHLVESAGANLLNFAVETWSRAGGWYYRLARLSAAGIPTITVLHGPSTAGGAYMPGMSDYVIAIKKRGRAALAGAALLHAATGEVADEEELGGAEMHATKSGLVEYLADDDAHGLVLARAVVAGLDWNRHCAAPPQVSQADGFNEPLNSPDEIAGLVPFDTKKPYDVREVIARLVDGSDIEDFKPRYGAATVCLHASIHGHRCGILGNNGPIDPDGATKGAHFIQLCDQARHPLIFLNNTTGYIVGTEYEQAGMIKHGSKMIQAVANVRVPRIALYIGSSYGAGNYGMSGQGFEPDFVLSWPTAKIGLMGGEQAAGTMSHVARVGAQRRGTEIDEEVLKAREQEILEHYERQSSIFYTSGRVLDQGLIDPRDTRKVLAFLLDTCWEARNRTLQPNVFGVARM